MSKAEKENRIHSFALEFLERQQIVPNFYADQIIRGYKEGYHQAEKDLELSREDMFTIFRLVNEVLDDYADGKTKKEVGEEVLKRFKDLKK